MCTVSYLPTSLGFILTSNRDEWERRLPALAPQKYIVHNTEVSFPKDQQAQGTWIAISEAFSLCLLNGAFVKHIQQPPYRLSRGIMLLDFFKYNDPRAFANNYNFEGIEPFCLLIISNTNLEFYEYRWDGSILHQTKIDSSIPHIWSSVTLYTDEIILQRKRWFQEWLDSHKHFSVDEITHFHQFAGEGDEENNVLMKRNNGIQTVSITSIELENKKLSMKYNDLLKNAEFNSIIV